MVSDQLRIVKHNILIEGGILDEVVLKWEGKELRVQSIYRPVAVSGKGSKKSLVGLAFFTGEDQLLRARDDGRVLGKKN